MSTYTAFAQDMWLATGSRDHIVQTLRDLPELPKSSDLLVFDDESGRQIDFDLRSAASEPGAGPGRPRLGVVAREVTLLPRHWDWLRRQPGGASPALRRLVEEASRQPQSAASRRDAAFQFLTVMAGDRPHYEEAIRALYRDDRDGFRKLALAWPPAVRDHALALAWPAAEALSRAPSAP